MYAGVKNNLSAQIRSGRSRLEKLRERLNVLQRTVDPTIEPLMVIPEDIFPWEEPGGLAEDGQEGPKLLSATQCEVVETWLLWQRTCREEELLREELLVVRDYWLGREAKLVASDPRDAFQDVGPYQVYARPTSFMTGLETAKWTAVQRIKAASRDVDRPQESDDDSDDGEEGVEEEEAEEEEEEEGGD